MALGVTYWPSEWMRVQITSQKHQKKDYGWSVFNFLVLASSSVVRVAVMPFVKAAYPFRNNLQLYYVQPYMQKIRWQPDLSMCCLAVGSTVCFHLTLRAHNATEGIWTVKSWPFYMSVTAQIPWNSRKYACKSYSPLFMSQFICLCWHATSLTAKPRADMTDQHQCGVDSAFFEILTSRHWTSANCCLKC